MVIGSVSAMAQTTAPSQSGYYVGGSKPSDSVSTEPRGFDPKEDGSRVMRSDSAEIAQKSTTRSEKRQKGSNKHLSSEKRNRASAK